MYGFVLYKQVGRYNTRKVELEIEIQMKEIEELEYKIVNEFDKILFRESVNCLKAKTYRAGYIIAWISIVESLKRKINDLSNIGDIQSQQSLSKIDALEKNEKSADIQILTESLLISIIEPDEYKKLQFFWGQRCLFAHPYEKAPTEDELIFIIKQSIEITLSKKLEFKKNYINELIENLSSKAHFLSNDNSVIENYAKNVIPRISKTLHSYFFKMLISKIGEIKDDEIKKIFLKRIRIFSVLLLKTTTQKLSDIKWRMEDLSLNHTYEFVLGTCDYRIWKKLPSRSKDIVLEFILQKSNKRERYFTTIMLSKIYKKNLFTKANSVKFEKLISSMEIIEASELYKDEKALSERFLIEFDSNDFYRQQDSIRVLTSDYGQIFQDKVSEHYAILIGKKITISSQYGCYEAQNVMLNINYRFTDNFRVGFVVGLFLDNQMTFRLSEKLFYTLLSFIDESESNFFNKVIAFIRINRNDEALERMQKARISDFKTEIDRIDNLKKYKKETIEFLKSVISEFK